MYLLSTRRLNFKSTFLGAAPFLVIAATWFLLCHGIVDPTFLPSMTGAARALWTLILSGNYFLDVWVSVYRVMGAFLLSAVLAIPIGLLAGYLRVVAHTIDPFVGFVRYLPVPAFVPLCILWFGLGDVAKIVVIFLGTFFQLILLVSDVARTVSKDYFDAASTLGATRSQLIYRILWPASLPGVMSACRTAVGWAWTYLVVAEIAGATSGIGFRIMEAQRYIETPKVFAGILVIGLLGMTTDLLFAGLYRFSFRWI